MVAAIMIVALLKNEELIIHISKKFRFKLDRNMVKNILKIGVPNGIENSMFQLGKILLLSVIAGFGTVSITANAVANSVTSFQVLPGAAIGLGLITVISQCVGANDYEQVRYYTKKLLIIAYISILAMNIVIISLNPYIIKAYNLSLETGVLASKVIIFYGICASLIWPLSFTLPNSLRASNDVRYTMIVGVGSMWIVRIGFGIILSKYLNMGMFGVWVAMIIDWVVRTMFFVTRYRGNKWGNKEKLS
jgi:Na+-driven multidrug efflux pump